jgi:hypothetical protein
MSGNIFVFWKESADPPSPWTRLTRQGRYVRFTDSVGYHLAQVGASTHNHSSSMASCTVYNCIEEGGLMGDSDKFGTDIHGHPAPGSWSISSNTNDPPYYGLDIIYMNLATWEAYEKRFPAGTIILSNGVLSDAGILSRFTSADGRFIFNTTPTATGGTSGTQSHRCQGTTGGAGGDYYCATGGGSPPTCDYHAHGIDLYSNATYQGPRQLITRLYEVLALSFSAKQNTVAFCDGSPGANWEILTGWTGANLVSGDSDPSISGSDTHSQSISGTTGTGGGVVGGYTEGWTAAPNHTHPIAATLTTDSHVPLSSLLVPMRLVATLYYGTAQRGAQLIGLY